jgi:energy-coupling factor transporter ATP-binding protein EcfA2
VIEHIRAKAGITVIVIEHKVDYLLPFGPRLVAMDSGRIVYDGPFDEAHRRPSLPARKPSSPPACGEPPVVRVENLHVGYNGQPVLRGLSLDVRAGEFVAVMGDNGSGKSTFLHSLLGLLKPDRGRVQVLGQDTQQVSVSRLARQVGFVFQNPDHQLFADGVWEEATFAPRNFGVLDGAAEARVGELLARCGLDDRRDDHPYRLSYGEKRRLNLVSVLAYGPRLVLLDEMLIGQDAANAAFLLELLGEQVDEGGAVIMVNHAPEVTHRYATRLLFFNDGNVIVDAPTEAAFEQLRSMGREAYGT